MQKFKLRTSKKQQGWIDSGNFRKFSAAVTAAANKTLVISRPETLDKNIIVPSNTHLFFLNSGSLVKGSAKKLVINGPLTAPITEIFIGFRPGDVTFGAGYLKEVYPQWWGARADGKTDDSSAIQSAIDSEVTVVNIIRGKYLLNKPLNLTDRFRGDARLDDRRMGITCQGQGMGANGTVLVGNTNGIVIDTTGSSYLVLKDFQISSGETNPSTVGILFARSTKGRCTEYNWLENIEVRLTSIPTANNDNGTVAIYNNAAELWTARNINLWADNPIVFAGFNIFGIKSPFAKHFPDWQSMSECIIDGTSILHAYSGPAITIQNATTMGFFNTYLTRTKGPNQFPYAIKVLLPWACNLTYTGHIENFGRVLYSNTDIKNLTLKTTIAGESPLIYLDGTGKEGIPGIVGGKIDIITAATEELMWQKLTKSFESQKDKPRHVIETAGNRQRGIRNTTIFLYRGQSIKAKGGYCTGNVIYAYDDNPSVIFSDAPGSFSYMVMARNGITFYGPVTIKDLRK